jgi:dTDP-4-amino-4,6-dideoxygalactose transaminase
MKVPYVDLSGQHAPLEEELLQAVREVLRHGQFILGPEVLQFEAKLAALLKVPHVVAVASGTDALTLALRLRSIGTGDDVLVPSHSFLATAHAVALVGARPVFVDIDPERLVMDPSLLEGALTSRTRAVIPVHLGGHPCDLEAFASVCCEYELELVEDCCQAIGTRYKGRSVGSFGIGAFSLHPLKTLSALGDAGFITVHSQADMDLVRRMRNLGLRDRDYSEFVADHSRLDTVHAAMLLVKLRYLEGYLKARRAHAEAYNSALSSVYRLIPVPEWAEPSYSAYVVRHPDRDHILAEARRSGIDLKVHYPVPTHRQAPYLDSGPWSLPETDRAVREIMSLPVSPELSVAQRDALIEFLVTF